MAASTVDPALIASVFKEAGLVPVAGVAAFQDPIASYTDRGMAIQYAGFIGDLIAELHGFGFEQVCLSAVQFPPMVSSRQSFGETGGLGRDGQLAADIAVWEERFAGEVTLWYEYPLASCTDVSPALGALPAQLGARNLVVSLPAGEAADPAALADLAARMKEQGCAYVVVRDSERGSFY